MKKTRRKLSTAEKIAVGLAIGGIVLTLITLAVVASKPSATTTTTPSQKQAQVCPF